LNLPPIKPETAQKVGKVISLVILKHVQDLAPAIKLDPQDLIPPIDIGLPNPPFNFTSEIILPDTHLSQREDGNSSGLYHGEIHLCKPTIYGLDTALHSASVTNITLVPIGAMLNYHLNGSESLSGTHTIAAAILLGLLRVESYGFFELVVENGFLDVHLGIGVDDIFNFKATSFGFDIGFDNFTIDANDSTWNGDKVDWNYISVEIVETFHAVWPALKLIVNDVLSPIVSDILTPIVKKCGLHDLPQLIDGNLDCLLATRGRITNEIILDAMQDLTEGEQRNLEFGSKDAKCVAQYTLGPLPPVVTTPLPADLPVLPSSSPAMQQGTILTLGLVAFNLALR